MANNDLPCWVYRSPRKQDTYLFLAEEDGFDRVPDKLLEQFGEPVLVIELELCSRRKLACADVKKVLKHLNEHGYYLQLPITLQPDLYHGNPI